MYILLLLLRIIYVISVRAVWKKPTGHRGDWYTVTGRNRSIVFVQLAVQQRSSSSSSRMTNSTIYKHHGRKSSGGAQWRVYRCVKKKKKKKWNSVRKKIQLTRSRHSTACTTMYIIYTRPFRFFRPSQRIFQPSIAHECTILTVTGSSSYPRCNDRWRETPRSI